MNLSACQYDLYNLSHWLMTDPFSSLDNIAANLTIYNVCGRFSMTTSFIDLQALSIKLWNASYNPRRLPAIVLRKTKPKATVLIFSTGRALVIGVESLEKLEEVSRKVAKEVGALLGIKKLRAEGLTVTNIMGVGQLGFKIDLGKLCESPRAIKYDNIPGVIYKLDEPIKKVMVHRNGKLIFWGGKSLDDIDVAYDIMRREMQVYEFTPKRESSECFDLEMTTA